MRAVGRLGTSSVGSATTAKQALLVSSSSFCSSGGGGGGGSGRGRGTTISSPFSSPVPGKSGAAGDGYDASAEADRASTPLGHGRGRGRGKPLPPPPLGNVFSPWMSSPPPSAGRGLPQPPPPSSSPPAGRGRPQPPPSSSPPPSAGRGRPQPPPSPLRPPAPDSAPKGPFFFRRFDDADSDFAPSTRGAGRGQTARPPETDTETPIVFHRENADSEPAQSTDSVQAPRAGVLPQSILKGMHGAGRGKTVKPPETDAPTREENRHIRPGGRQPGSASAPRLSSEGRGGRGGRGVSRFEGVGRGRGEGGRGRDRERRRGRRGRGGRKPEDEAQEEDPSLLLGGGRFDENRLQEMFDENGLPERLRERLGEENFTRLKEVFDEALERTVPSECNDAYLDALDTNFLVSLLFMLG